MHVTLRDRNVKEVLWEAMAMVWLARTDEKAGINPENLVRCNKDDGVCRKRLYNLCFTWSFIFWCVLTLQLTKFNNGSSVIKPSQAIGGGWSDESSQSSCLFIAVFLGVFFLLQDGNTPLHVTALHNECCHVSDLMAYGADTSIQNKVKYSIFERTVFYKEQ